MRAIMVAVGYTDLLKITLPYNRGHFEQVTVVTSSEDAPNVIPVCVANGAGTVVTDLFYANGAHMNKWAGLEYGLDQMGRSGWLCLMDADVLWPKSVKHFYPNKPNVCEETLNGCALLPGVLYAPLRRMWNEWPNTPNWHSQFTTNEGLPEEYSWHRFPIHRNVAEWAGYSQIFHADDPVLKKCGNCGELRETHEDKDLAVGTCRRRGLTFAWYQTDWVHAGGADSMFQERWRPEHKARPPFEVLHLGPAGQNWYGRATTLADGKVPEGAAERLRACQDIWTRRHLNPVGDKYRGERLGNNPGTAP